MKIFVSVGTGLNAHQEAFVSAVEARLRAVGLEPCTIGRNTFSAEAPLRAVVGLMDRCAGAVVIALERYHFREGIERRGSNKEKPLNAVSLPTPWNQIEAAMAYGRGLPLLVLVDEQLRCDGLLEKGNDWFVQELAVDPASLNTVSFSGVIESWRERVVSRSQQKVPPYSPAETRVDISNMRIAQLLGALKPAELWATLIALCGAVAAAFALGARFAP